MQNSSHSKDHNYQPRTHNQKEIVAEFNTYLNNIGPKLPSEIPNPSKLFETFLKQIDATMTTHC